MGVIDDYTATLTKGAAVITLFYTTNQCIRIDSDVIQKTSKVLPQAIRLLRHSLGPASTLSSLTYDLSRPFDNANFTKDEKHRKHHS